MPAQRRPWARVATTNRELAMPERSVRARVHCRPIALPDRKWALPQSAPRSPLGVRAASLARSHQAKAVQPGSRANDSTNRPIRSMLPREAKVVEQPVPFSAWWAMASLSLAACRRPGDEREIPVSIPGLTLESPGPGAPRTNHKKRWLPGSSAHTSGSAFPPVRPASSRTCCKSGCRLD